MTKYHTAADLITGLWPVTLEEYHADCSAIGHSMIDLALDDLREYEALHVAKTLAPKEPTDAMTFGSMFHSLALEPHKFDEEYLAIPPFGPDGEKWDKRGSVHREAWRALEADPRKKYSAEDANLMFRMIQALDADEQASSYLFAKGPCEEAIRWIDGPTGLTLKACRDKVADGVIINLKTCGDASAEQCAKSAGNFGYHRAAAHYLDGHEAAFGKPAAGHLFIFVSKTRLPRVFCLELGNRSVELGRRQNRNGLNRIAEAMATGNWANPEEGKVIRADIPEYHFRSDYEVSNG